MHRITYCTTGQTTAFPHRQSVECNMLRFLSFPTQAATCTFIASGACLEWGGGRCCCALNGLPAPYQSPQGRMAHLGAGVLHHPQLLYLPQVCLLSADAAKAFQMTAGEKPSLANLLWMEEAVSHMFEKWLHCHYFTGRCVFQKKKHLIKQATLSFISLKSVKQFFFISETSYLMSVILLTSSDEYLDPIAQMLLSPKDNKHVESRVGWNTNYTQYIQKRCDVCFSFFQRIQCSCYTTEFQKYRTELNCSHDMGMR